jgi:hypothetical protein
MLPLSSRISSSSSTSFFFNNPPPVFSAHPLGLSLRVWYDLLGKKKTWLILPGVKESPSSLGVDSQLVTEWNRAPAVKMMTSPGLYPEIY